MTHKHVVIGGTFDRLHKGHISYLKTAFENADRVTIGLTTDELHSDKEFKQIIQAYNLRKKELFKIIKKRWPQTSVTVAPIDDIYGPSITDSTIDTIILTDLTLENGKKINSERLKRGLNKLNIVTYPQIESQDNLILSSSRIRRGEIDREGKVYGKSFFKTLILPRNLRLELRKPLGRVVKGSEIDKEKVASEVAKILDKEKHGLSIAVGDIVSSTLKSAGFLPDIEIIDFKTQRKFLQSFDINEKFDTENIAGTISSTSAKLLEIEIRKILKNKSKKTITINGEEDLLVLPAILLAPLNSVVFYGLRDLGMVLVKVTEKTKKQSAELIERFI